MRHLWRVLHPTRWPVFFALTVLCLLAGENYPFSNFPMYSSFAKNSYYIYLANAAGQPLASASFGLTTPGLKKIFESKRRAQFRHSGMIEPAQADQAAGAALLRYLDELPAVARKPALLPGLQVRRVNILWEAGGITAQTETVAQQQ